MIDRWCGAVRWLWNTSLGIRSEAYRECRLSLSGIDVSRWVTEWKRTPGHTWLADVPATCLSQCLRDQDRAFANFFAHRARYPKFKPKRAGGSLRFQGIGVGWSRGLLSLPKLGRLKLAEALPGSEKPDMVTLCKDALGRYFVSYSTEIEPSSLSLPIVNRSVGVDLGLTHLATLSTGEKVPNPKRLKAHLRYLKQQQRCLSRRKKDSKRRERQRQRVARIQAKIRQERQAAMHALTTRLVREFAGDAAGRAILEVSQRSWTRECERLPPVVTTGTCAWMREVHASMISSSSGRCSQRKRETGTASLPVRNRRARGSSVVNSARRWP